MYQAQITYETQANLNSLAELTKMFHARFFKRTRNEQQSEGMWIEFPTIEIARNWCEYARQLEEKATGEPTIGFCIGNTTDNLVLSFPLFRVPPHFYQILRHVSCGFLKFYPEEKIWKIEWGEQTEEEHMFYKTYKTFGFIFHPKFQPMSSKNPRDDSERAEGL